MKRSMKLAKDLIGYYNTTRGVGHTYAAISGLRNSSHLAALVTPWSKESEAIKRRHNVECVSLGDIGTKLLGKRVPIVLDNTAVLELCQIFVHDLQQLETEIEELMNKNINLEAEKRELAAIKTVMSPSDTRTTAKLSLENRMLKNEVEFLKRAISSIQESCEVALEEEE